MTTPQPAALPELPMPDLYAHELILNGGGVWLGVPEKGICEQAHIEGETGEEIREFYTADQMRARDAMWAERLAALQPQPAAAAVSDEQIRDALEAEFLGEPGKRNLADDLRVARAVLTRLRPQADTLCFYLSTMLACPPSDSDVVSAVESLLPLRPQAGPMTDEQSELEAEVERLRGLLKLESLRDHSHQCLLCLHPYTPLENQSEDCPSCGFDGINAQGAQGEQG